MRVAKDNDSRRQTDTGLDFESTVGSRPGRPQDEYAGAPEMELVGLEILQHPPGKHSNRDPVLFPGWSWRLTSGTLALTPPSLARVDLGPLRPVHAAEVL